MLLRGRSDFALYLRPDARTGQPKGRAAARPATNAGRSQPRPRDHRLLLDHQGADHRDGRVHLGLPGAHARPAGGGADRRCRVRRRPAVAAAGRSLLGVAILVRRGHGGCLRHDGRRRAARRPGDSLRRLDHLLRRRPDAGVPDLATQRGDALDPQHPHPPARALLLGGGAGDVCPGNGGRRHDGADAGAGLPRLRRHVRRPDRRAGDRLPAVRHGPDPRLLVRLHRHPAAGRVLRRLDVGLARRGGLGLGYGTVSLLLSVLIVGFVAYLASSRIDVAAPESAPAVD